MLVHHNITELLSRTARRRAKLKKEIIKKEGNWLLSSLRIPDLLFSEEPVAQVAHDDAGVGTHVHFLLSSYKWQKKGHSQISTINTNTSHH